MNETKNLIGDTDRRFAILMTAMEDFMKAYGRERQQLLNLAQINRKVAEKPTEKPESEKESPSKKKRKKKKPKKEEKTKNVDEKPEPSQEKDR